MLLRKVFPADLETSSLNIPFPADQRMPGEAHKGNLGPCAAVASYKTSVKLKSWIGGWRQEGKIREISGRNQRKS